VLEGVGRVAEEAQLEEGVALVVEMELGEVRDERNINNGCGGVGNSCEEINGIKGARVGV
jgi:hypothetical protein